MWSTEINHDNSSPSCFVIYKVPSPEPFEIKFWPALLLNNWHYLAPCILLVINNVERKNVKVLGPYGDIEEYSDIMDKGVWIYK